MRLANGQVMINMAYRTIARKRDVAKKIGVRRAAVIKNQVVIDRVLHRLASNLVPIVQRALFKGAFLGCVIHINQAKPLVIAM